MRKVINPGSITFSWSKLPARVYVEIKYEDGNLSIHGVEGPLPSGNCRGSCGQILDDVRQVKPAKEWTYEMVSKLCDIWERWHLNSMRAGCEHQRNSGREFEVGEPCPVCGYRYGSAWLREEVPQDVIGWLESLPDAKHQPAWV